MSYRIGIGYDIHQLSAKRDLILGGIKIPYEKGLLGHSDADVLIHAIIDAILGALALGDIGQHFPPEDQQFKDADSTILLKKINGLLENYSYEIINIDSNVILEKPKLKDFILPMRKKIANILNVELNQVSIKAKTNEKLGDIGSGKAIASQVVVLIQKQ